MMFVIESGCHSRRICPFQLLEREYLWLRLLPNDEVVPLKKFSVELFEKTSPSLWFQRTLPSSLSLPVFS